MIARDAFGAIVIALVYCAVFMAVFWVVMTLGDSSGTQGPLQRFAAAVLAVLGFPVISPFLYFNWFSRLMLHEFLGAMIRLAFLNGLLWGVVLVWAHRKLLNRLGRTRLL
jgi:hypothetical protein